MNFVQKLEECLRDLGTEARKQNAGVPGVKEAAEHGTLRLRQLQASYVAAVREANNNKSGSDHPTTSIFQSSDLLHPFLWATNYPNVNPALLDISFRAMKLLMESDAIVYSDGLDLIRVWTIQAQVGVSFYKGSHSDFPEENSTASTAGSGGWFSWGGNSKDGPDGHYSHHATPSKPKNAVSSSNGQSGLSQASAKDIEKRALGILSCLLQLLELVSDDPVSQNPELWTTSVSLCCLWLRVLPPRHTVRQAAQSTLAQVLSICLVDAIDPKSTFAIQTWNDLLALTGEIPRSGLTGAFRSCKSGPPPEFALELLTRVGASNIQNDLMPRVCQVTMTLLQQYRKIPAERYLRLVQWTNQVIQIHHVELHNECVELLSGMCKIIPLASDACRSNHDFEDGYVYSSSEQLKSEAKDSVAVNRKVALFPAPVLYKTAFVLEVIFYLVESVPRLFDSDDLVSSIAEALSDFATLGASCQSHNLQLVEYCDRMDLSTSWQPSLIRHAEHVLAGGTSLDATEREFRKNSGTSTLLGEALWTTLNGILRINESLPISTVERSFASSLAVLQHYLKRFTGCSALVQLSLRGYGSLAKICFSSPMPRKALLSSLCKLSLPTWGKLDSAGQLQDHHVRSLLCLFRILHVHHAQMESDWEIVLVTMQELSILAIASNKLGEEAYHAALAVAAVFERFASFSTCLSKESFLSLIASLTEIAPACIEKRDTPGHKEASQTDKAGNVTIGGKIVNLGVRAIYGQANGGASEPNSDYSSERTNFTFYEEYRQNFLLRIGKVNGSIRMVEGMPFCLTLIVDVTMANAFRYKECGERISLFLSQLAAASPPLRDFCMDTLATLTMEQITNSAVSAALFAGPGRLVVEDPMQSQLLAVEPLTGKRGPVDETLRDYDHSESSIPQSDLLGPLCSSIRSTVKAEIAEASLGTLSSILESTGHNLSGSVWFVVVDTVASLSGDPSDEVNRTGPAWDICCLGAFRCLKLIVDDFSDEVRAASQSSSTRRNPLLDCCASFGSSLHDINTSLTAIGLLWTIADQDVGSDAISHALSRLADLASDDRPEVRNAAVNTLFSCIVGKGESFTSLQWKTCFEDTIFAVYRLVLSKLNPEAKHDQQAGVKSKSSRYHVNLHHTRDSASKQWLATQVLVLRGLVRVLRGNFPKLLASADAESSASSESPWFLDAWVYILDFAYEAASQKPERDTLDICTIGGELILDCCQLSSSAGIHAAITPARVGTNMEVVNGALRSVRDAKEFDKLPIERARSRDEESMRENLFLEAFEGVHSLHEYISKNSEVDDIKLQIVHRFCTGLSKLYDCCKDEEFQTGNTGDSSAPNAPPLVDRFLGIVASLLRVATVDPAARFLNQAQRCSVELLESMVGNGSFEAFRLLIALAGVSFFIRKDADAEGSKQTQITNGDTSHDLVGFEISVIVSKAVSKNDVPILCRVKVLDEVLELFLERNSVGAGYHKHAYYKRMVPIIESGLKAATEMETDGAPAHAALLADVWRRTYECVTKMLTPVPIGKEMFKVPRVTEVSEILGTVVSCAPSSRLTSLSSVLTFGASKAILVALDHGEFALAGDGELNRKSKKHMDELFKLFGECVAAACGIDAGHETLHSIVRSVFDGSGNDTSESRRRFYRDASITVCRHMSELVDTEPLVVAVFPSLCSLLTGENEQLREAAASVFDSVDISGILESTNRRCEAAERFAAEAETRTNELEATVAELQAANAGLQREVAILEASASAGI